MKKSNYDPVGNARLAYSMTAAIENSPVRLSKGLYNWLCSHFNCKTDPWDAVTFYNAGYVAGIREERNRRNNTRKELDFWKEEARLQSQMYMELYEKVKDVYGTVPDPDGE